MKRNHQADLYCVGVTNDACVTVVLASEHYPASPRTGDVIDGAADAARTDGTIVFHAGTARRGEDLVTAGGRVFAVSALGASIASARERAYAAADQITWRGRQCRRDIAVGV